MDEPFVAQLHSNRQTFAVAVQRFYDLASVYRHMTKVAERAHNAPAVV
jgi:hypothetical protein